jgi:hypothetical protein
LVSGHGIRLTSFARRGVVIHKVSRGAGFRGALSYVLAKEHAPLIVGGNMAGRNARDLTREFARTRQL